MKREEHNIDQYFRNGLQDYESPLAANLWDKLDAAREEDEKPKGIIWWKWGIGALLLTLLTATTLYFITNQKTESNEPTTRLDTNAPITSVAPAAIPDAPVTGLEEIAETTNDGFVDNQNRKVELKNTGAPLLSEASTQKSNQQRTRSATSSSITQNPKSKTQNSKLKTQNSKPKTQNTTASSLIQPTKSTDSQPIANTVEKELPGKIKSTQQLKFLNSNAATLLDNAPDLHTIFDAPPIKIPFSWGPKGCYSFAGGRIKYDYYVDAFIAPEYVIRNLTARTAEDNPYRQRREDTEATLYGISGGVRLSVVTRRGLALRTGIVYNRILERFNLEIEGDERIVQIVPAGTTDTITTIEKGTSFVRTYNRYHAIDIPLLLGYEIDAGNFNFSINAGAYFNIYARQKGKILSQSDTPEFITSNNPQRINAFEKDLGISIYGSVGLNYQIRPNLQLLVEPNFRYQLKPITLETYPLEQQYINIGLLLGVRRQF